MSPVEFEPVIPVSEPSRTHAFDLLATGIGILLLLLILLWAYFALLNLYTSREPE
jgi:hypothetical protein